MLVTRKSNLTGKVHTLNLPITQEQLWDIEARERPLSQISVALTPEQRDFLLTGVTPDEWFEALCQS